MDEYVTIVKNIEKYLSVRGFIKKRGANIKYYKYGELILSVQKSVKSTKSAILFCVNIYFRYYEIDNYLIDMGFRPNYQYVDRFSRLKNSIIEEVWWEIKEGTDVDIIVDEFVIIFDDMVSFMLESLNNEIFLIYMWRSGNSPGLTIFQRLLNLMIYYHLNDRINELISLTEDIKKNITDKAFQTSLLREANGLLKSKLL